MLLRIEVSVQTQIGVNVEFTADSRDYVKDSTEATGTYRLVDADRGIVYEELQLTGRSDGILSERSGQRVTGCFRPAISWKMMRTDFTFF